MAFQIQSFHPRFLLPRVAASLCCCSTLPARTTALLRLLPQRHGRTRLLCTTIPLSTTLMQVLRQPRTKARARHAISPALHDRPQMKGVCLRVGTMKPKKPNSGERKIARVKLSSGKLITAYIPGEGAFSFPADRRRSCLGGEGREEGRRWFRWR